MIKLRITLLIATLFIATNGHSQTMIQGSPNDLGLMVNGTIQASATSGGNLIVRTDPTAASHVATKNYVDNAITPETDPQVGTLTNGSWCTTNGSTINCTSTAPSSGTFSCITRTAASGSASTATCTSGYTVTGGGCRTNAGVRQSYISGNGWYCRSHDDFDTATAYARCCKI